MNGPRRLVVLGLVSIFALPVTAESFLARSQRDARTELEGTWDGVQSTLAKKVRAYRSGELTMKFEGSKLTTIGLLSVLGEEKDTPFVIRPDRKPKEFDYQQGGGVTKECIYEMRGDRLILAIPRRSAGRPTSFDSSTDSVTVVELRRRK